MDTKSISSCSSTITATTTASVIKLFGVTISCDRGCYDGKKDCTSKSFLSSATFPTSTLLKRKRSSFSSLSLPHSYGERVSKPTFLIKSEKKKKTNNAQSLLPEQKEQEKLSRLGISLELSFLHEPWKIRKTLYQSDIGSHCWLLISRKDATAHIIPFMDGESRKAIESGDGLDVIIEDMGTGTEHNLVLRYLFSMKGYVLRKRWNTEFVKRRELQEGDEVGLRWVVRSRKFNFSVLDRSNNRRPKG